MSNTGTYVYDPELKKVIKISDKTGLVSFSDVTFTKPFWTNDITGSPVLVKSARHKRDLMKKHNLREPSSSKEGIRSNFKSQGCTTEFVANHLRRKNLLKHIRG